MRTSYVAASIGKYEDPLTNSASSFDAAFTKTIGAKLTKDFLIPFLSRLSGHSELQIYLI